MISKIQIDLHEDRETLVCKIPYAQNYLVQQMVDKRWRKAERVWYVPINWRNVEMIGRDFKVDWMSEQALVAIAKYKQEHANKVKKTSEFPAPANHTFKTKPFGHQSETYDLAYDRKEFGLFYEQGLGKTKVAIDLCAMWGLDAVLVICPVSIRSVWEKEFAIHYPFTYELRRLDTKNRKFLKMWWINPDIPGLKVLVCGVESLSQGSAHEIATEFGNDVNNAALIVDESSRIKNFKAIRTERTVKLGKLFDYRLALTGTPVTQGLQDLYSQFQFLNPDILGFKSYYSFRNRYCVMGGFNDMQIVSYKNVPELLELVEHHCVRYEKEDCLDLPPKLFQERSIPMTPTQSKAYHELRRHLVTKIDGRRIEVTMILEAYLRLQQIAGGFYPGEEQGDPALPIPGKNPKIEELKLLMDELKGRKVVIWSRFRAEVQAIVEALESDFEVVQFHGGLTEEEKKWSVDQFQEGSANVWVATEQSGAYGLTLTAAHTAIYYSMGFSLEEYLQSQDRIHRIGQTISCSYILLGCTGTVDENVIRILQDKKSLADFVSERLKEGEEIF